MLVLCFLFLLFSCEEGLAPRARVSSRRHIGRQSHCVSASAGHEQVGGVGKLYKGEYTKNVSFHGLEHHKDEAAAVHGEAVGG